MVLIGHNQNVHNADGKPVTKVYSTKGVNFVAVGRMDKFVVSIPRGGVTASTKRSLRESHLREETKEKKKEVRHLID